MFQNVADEPAQVRLGDRELLEQHLALGGVDAFALHVAGEAFASRTTLVPSAVLIKHPRTALIVKRQKVRQAKVEN